MKVAGAGQRPYRVDEGRMQVGLVAALCCCTADPFGLGNLTSQQCDLPADLGSGGAAVHAAAPLAGLVGAVDGSQTGLTANLQGFTIGPPEGWPLLQSHSPALDLWRRVGMGRHWVRCEPGRRRGRAWRESERPV